MSRPAARSRLGLIIGLVAGASALVLLACCGVAYLALKSFADKPAPQVAPPLTPSPTARAYRETLQAGRLRLQVEIDPAKTGDNLIHLQAFTPDGRPQRVEEWTVSVSLPAAGIDLGDVPVLKLSENHAVGSVSLSAPGRWEFQFTLRISATGAESVAVQIPIN